MRRRRTLVLAVVSVVTAGAVWVVVRPFLSAASIIAHVVGLEGRVRSVANVVNHAPFTEQPLDIPTRHGAIRARLYRPDAPTSRTVLVMPGVNPAGIDEPRLATFARALAKAGFTAVAIELPDLTRYRVRAQDVDRIEDAALWLSARQNLTRGESIGVAGVSFAAGLAVSAAGRTSLDGRLAFVASFGGYGDLTRVVRFLCLGVLPDGSHGRPHDYGLAVILLNVLDRLVPPEQVVPLERAIDTFMDASWLDLTDQAAAQRVFDRARALQAELPEPSATIMRWVNDRDVDTAGPRLWPDALAMASEPALSPERSQAPHAPVYLLHGDGDNVIPTQESERLAAWLAPHTRVRVLVTPLITHVDAGTPQSLADVWALVRFWTAVLSE